MRYKGLEINGEWDLYIGVEFENDVHDVVNSVFKVMKNNGIAIEVVLKGYLIIISPANFNFTKEGVEHFVNMYKLLQNSDIDGISLDVNVQADDFVFGNDDDGYNLDTVTLDEFLENLEY